MWTFEAPTAAFCNKVTPAAPEATFEPNRVLPAVVVAYALKPTLPSLLYRSIASVKLCTFGIKTLFTYCPLGILQVVGDTVAGSKKVNEMPSASDVSVDGVLILYKKEKENPFGVLHVEFFVNVCLKQRKRFVLNCPVIKVQ